MKNLSKKVVVSNVKYFRNDTTLPLEKEDGVYVAANNTRNKSEWFV